MIVSSKFLQLNQYVLLEYIYNSSVISTEDVTFARIYNAYNGTVSYMCHNKSDINIAKELTANTMETTAMQRSDNEYVHLDIDRPLKWFETQNDNIYIEGLWKEYDSNSKIINDLEIRPEQYILYDQVKLHIVEGYNFDDLAGIFIKLGYVDAADFSAIYVANYAYLKGNDNIEFHSRPFILGDRAYNRYLTFKVPSLKGITESNNVLKNSLIPTKPPFDIKFPDINNSQINIIFYEINKISNERGQTIINTNLPIGSDTNGIVRLTIEKEDAMKNLAANIQESAAGDYFELFPSKQGQFIDDFLYERAKFGEEYRVIHDIDVYEQISSMGSYSEIKNQSITFFQTEGFNKPFKFRPIIENPNAIAFTIDYTVRLVNIYDVANPMQTIRKASLTYKNPQKYGKSFVKLNIEQGYKPQKIVNKITKVDNNYINTQDIGSNNSVGVVKELIDNYIFVDETNIVLDINNIPVLNNIVINPSISNTSDLINSDILFGKGYGTIYLSEFDNFIKISFYSIIDKTSQKYVLPSNTYKLVFEDTLGVKIRIDELNTNNSYNISKNSNELIFKVDSLTAKKILSSNNNTFHIISTNPNAVSTFEISIFNGKVADINATTKTDNILNKKYEYLNNIQDDIIATTQKMSAIKDDITKLIEKTQVITLSDVQRNQLEMYIQEFENIVKKYSEL